MELLKYAVFGFEHQSLPASLSIVEHVQATFSRLPHGAHTNFQLATALDDGARLIDDLKSRTCGSSYDLAVINTLHVKSAAELDFLLSEAVLGDPCTVFLATLHGLEAQIYRFARDKIEREAEQVSAGQRGCTPSCMVYYSGRNRREKATRVANLVDAFLDARECPNDISKTEEALGKTDTSFIGRTRF